MDKGIRHVLEDFCHLHQVPFSEGLIAIFQEWNRVTGNAVFLIQGAGITPVRYEQQRIDLTPYSAYNGLQLIGEQTSANQISKSSIASWFNRHVNHRMLASDIGQLVTAHDRVTVVASSNSMRFKRSFFMRFK